MGEEGRAHSTALSTPTSTGVSGKMNVPNAMKTRANKRKTNRGK